jgi:hypothetical protein
MSKHSQDRSPRLAIVGPTDGKTRQQPAGPQWWGPQRAGLLGLNNPEGTAQTKQSSRMAVMPASSRGFALEAITWIWNFVRGYFVTGSEQQRGAVILSFRRNAGQARGLSRAVDDEYFAGKKESGSVGWNSDHEVAPQEGGSR